MANRNLLLSAGGAGGGNLYVEDVFSTYLYAGNGSTQTITNGIDLDGEGGLVWIKNRDQADNNILSDTERGVLDVLYSNSNGGSGSVADTLTAFNSDGFSIGSDVQVNTSAEKYVSWTFRKSPKFFDVVTYTGTGTRFRTVAHNLGSVPGCIMVKRTDTSSNWTVYHRSNSGNPRTDYLVLNSTTATADQPYWEDTAPTDSVFTVNNNSLVNASGGTYVAYLFAHEDGGFGDDGEQNIISCGGYTGNGNTTGPIITLGWEPQWLLIKSSSVTGSWNIIDNMRGFCFQYGSVDAELYANANSAESSADVRVSPTPTGFQLSTADSAYNSSSATYIYIAIRRGPMKIPESATEVFETVAYTGDNSGTRVIGSEITPDLVIISDRQALSTAWTAYAHYVYDRMRGENVALATTAATAQTGGWANGYFNLDQQIGWRNGSSNTSYLNNSSTTYVSQIFRRAPGFFDIVGYIGTGVAQAINHNLGVAPELMIVKNTLATDNWAVYSDALGPTKFLWLNSTAKEATGSTYWNNTAPTDTHFTVGTIGATGENTRRYIAYLFATLPGISKVGSYIGTGGVQQIDCGFSTGAKFILIKRTNNTGGWYFWDSARGIVSGNDPYLFINNFSAEVTDTDYIDPLSSGFEISGSGGFINASGSSYIFLAIA